MIRRDNLRDARLSSTNHPLVEAEARGVRATGNQGIVRKHRVVQKGGKAMLKLQTVMLNVGMERVVKGRKVEAVEGHKVEGERAEVEGEKVEEEIRIPKMRMTKTTRAMMEISRDGS
jgi:hypothetical protein